VANLTITLSAHETRFIAYNRLGIGFD